MPFGSGTSACATCATILTDAEMYDGVIYSCPACSPTPYFHAVCVAPDGIDLHCPECAVGLIQEYVDAWGADEPEPVRSEPDWTDRLYAFLGSPPPAADWDYLSYQHGGHELCWKGVAAAFGADGVAVRFHVHFTGRYYDGNPDWRYGGAWVKGVRSAELSVDEARELHGTLLPVVQRHWIAMLDTEESITSSRTSSGSWRKA